jgi:hypothetical protein
MKRYLLCIYQPDGPPPPPATLEPIMRKVQALRQEMETSGALVLTAGLNLASSATVVKLKGDDVLMTDGPYLEGKEHIGGFSIIEAEDLDAALEWARKLARATTLPIEVRPVQEK